MDRVQVICLPLSPTFASELMTASSMVREVWNSVTIRFLLCSADTEQFARRTMTRCGARGPEF